MQIKSEFWKKSSLDWESKRYDRFFSRFLYGSLHNRRDYVAWYISQFPKGSKIVELGCGSGRIYERIIDRQKYNYTGIDICGDAVSVATEKFKNEPNAKWVCASENEIKNYEADLAVSAGFIDWLNDEQIINLNNNNKFKAVLHSYSQDTADWKVYVHRFFSKLITKRINVDYSPRKYSIEKIRSLFGNNISIETDSELSFGAFVRTKELFNQLGYEKFKISKYFLAKGGSSISPIEQFFKKIETSTVLKNIDIEKHKTILDFGAGAGHYVNLLLKAGAFHVTAVDPFVKTTVAPEYSEKFEYFKNTIDIEAAQYKKFDLILLTGVLEFVENPSIILQDLIKRLNRNGTLLVMCPKPGLWYYFYKLFHFVFGRKINSPPSIKVETFLAENNLSFVRKNCGPLNYVYAVTHEK